LAQKDHKTVYGGAILLLLPIKPNYTIFSGIYIGRTTIGCVP